MKKNIILIITVGILFQNTNPGIRKFFDADSTIARAVQASVLSSVLTVGGNYIYHNYKQAELAKQAEQAEQAEQAKEAIQLAIAKQTEQNYGFWGYKSVSNLNPYLKVGLGLVAAGGLTYGAWRMTRKYKPRTQLKNEQVK
jgi:hypothetical protein